MSHNYDKRTDTATARRLILKGLLLFAPHHCAIKSTLGYLAFPDYHFNSPQAAAFSVAKIARDMREEGLITSSWHGWKITQKGRDMLAGEGTL